MGRQRRTALLWAERERWTLYRCDVLGEPVFESLATDSTLVASPHELRVALAEHNLVRAPMVVALESDLCLACTFEAASPRQARNREALAYQLEEPLPVAAEEVAADFVVDGGRVFGVCCDRAWLERLLDQLAEAGAEVRCVTPAALLATAQLDRESEWESAAETYWSIPGVVDRVLWENGKPRTWRRCSASGTHLDTDEACQRLVGVEPASRVLVGELAALDALADEDDAERIETSGDPCLAYAARAAERIASGNAEPPVDLLRGLSTCAGRFRDPLAKEWLALKCAAVLLLASATGWQLSRAHAAHQAIRRIEAAQADVFRETFPEKRLPLGIRARLESELRRIAGTRADITKTPKNRDAVLLLQQLAAELPPDLRYRLLELRIEDRRVYLVGEVRAHSDADKIAASLRRAGLTVSPPSTQQLASEGVEFRLTAEPTADDGEPAA